MLKNGAITWSLKKQHLVALSSTESEYIAQTHAAKEALWLKSFFEEVDGESRDAMEVHCDNQGAIVLAKDNKFHSRTKHINLCYHFLREAVEDGKILMKYIPTLDNVADIFMKALPRPRFVELAKRLGLEEKTRGVGE